MLTIWYKAYSKKVMSQYASLFFWLCLTSVLIAKASKDFEIKQFKIFRGFYIGLI
jgi:hypothetical protein